MVTVTCTKCHAILRITPRITDEEMRRLMADHLREQHPEPLRSVVRGLPPDSNATTLGEVVDQYA